MKTPKKISIGLAALVGAFICFYILAIVIRQYAIPLYVNVHYKQSVNHEFDTSFAAFNRNLESLGFTPYRASGFDQSSKSATCYNHVTDNGQNGYYHHFSETVPCIKQVHTSPFVPDNEFITAWESDSHKLPSTLSVEGWTMTRNFVAGSDLSTSTQSQQNITKIFDVPNTSPANQYAAEIDYSKNDGKFKCSLSLSYANNGPSPVKSVWLDESCERDVSFFGGSTD